MADRGNQVQEVKEAIDIIDLVSQYTTLVPAGRRMKGLSPFTNEKTPSFFVDPDAGVYYCFSSQKGGDIFTFIQETEGVDFKEALKILADRAGIDLISNQSDPKQNNEPLYHALETAVEVYQRNLNKEVLEYLQSRGINEESVRSWSIGYAPDAWNTLCAQQMPNLDVYSAVGMCVQKEKSVYDRFRGRVQFPFHNDRGRVIGFSGRIYGNSEGAKYINSPESPLFHKSTFLYGLHKAKPYIRKHNVAMITEGPVDAIMMHQAGYPMTVATSGTAITREHLMTLRRLSNRLLIVLDGDAAGKRAALRVVEMAFILDIDNKVVVLPEGNDPADLICADVDQFKHAVKEAHSAVGFLTHYVTEMYGAGREDHLRGVKEVILPIITAIKDPLTREYAVNEIASFCGLSKESVVESIQQTSPAVREQNTVKPKKQITVSTGQKKDSVSQRIHGLLHSAALASIFLKESNETPSDKVKDLFQKVENSESFPEIDKKVAVLHYEERFPTARDRISGAKADLEKTLKVLYAELKKRTELQRSRSFSR